MSLFTKLVKKSVVDFLHKWKKWLITITLFLGLLIGVNLVLNHYVDKVVGSLIKEFVREKSEGFYYVDFEEIAYILNSGKFYVSELIFDIHPDHQKNLDLEDLNHNYLYKAEIPILQIDIIDFWSIFVSRKLRVIGVEITQPIIKIINLNKDKKPKKLSFEAGNLYEILSGQLKELKVNDFLISEGEFDYTTYKGPDYDNFNIKELTFAVNNFLVNEEATSRKDKIFYTDDIFLEIKDQELLLKDSIHKVSFDKFYISTSSNEFGFENFNLTRRKDPDINVKKHDHYEIKLPILRLAGIDFVNAYNNNLLKIDSLNIEDPVVNIKKRIKKDRQDSSRNTILDAAMFYHDFLIINHFNLDDAYLNFTDETKALPKQYTVDHVSAHLTNVEIDTGSYSKYQYGFNFDDAELIVKDYEVKLPDSVNTVKFEEFSISSNPFALQLKELNFQPDLQVNSNVDQSLIYASIPYLVISEFDVAQAINMDTFLIEEIYIENPDIKVIQSARQDKNKADNGPGGLFGICKNIQSISDYFKLNKLNLIDGKFELQIAEENQLNLVLDQINVSLENLEVDSLTNTKNDVFGKMDVDLSVNDSFLEIPKGSISVQRLDFNSNPGRLLIDSLYVSLDTSEITQNIDVVLPNVLLTGIEPNEIVFNNIVILDSLKFRGVNISADLLSDLTVADQDSNKNEQTSLPRIAIRHLIGIDYDVDIREKGFPLFYADNINFNISNLVLDQSLSDNPLNQFDYDEIKILSVDNYDLYLRNQNHLFRSQKIHWDNNSSTFYMKGMSMKPFGAANNSYTIDIPSIVMAGIDLKKVLKESFYDGEDITIDHPKINLKLSQGKQEKLTSLDLGYIPLLLRNRYLGAKVNNFEINNAEINFHQQVKNDSLMVEIENLNLLVENFEVDSTTEMIPNQFLFANDIRLQADYLSCFFPEKSNFYNVNHINISTKEHDILLSGIYYATNTNDFSFTKPKTRISIDNLNIMDFDFFDFTQNRILDISEIQIDNAEMHQIPAVNKADVAFGSPDSVLYQEVFGEIPAEEKIGFLQSENKDHSPDSLLLDDIKQALNAQFQKLDVKNNTKKAGLNFHEKNYLFDTMLLKRVEIDRLLIFDSNVAIENSDEDKTGLALPEIWFLAEGLKYDPKAAKDSSRIFYTDNLVAKVSNFQYVLPDNLSSIRIDELLLNSKDSTIKANNFAFLPMVAQYDYGPAKGYQSTWMKMENDSITINKVDFLGILNERSLNANSVNIHKLDISIFRDKRVPFPEWQQKELPQVSLRGMNFRFEIDTINLHNGFISYQEHSEKAYTTGEVFFTDLDATIINATNDSVRTLTSPNTRVGVTTKIFGTGDIKAEFIFDLVDVENIHSYGIDVQPFDLTEFNRMLIPSASIQISNGASKKIIMNAKANEDYSYGEMKFYYEDLKIQLLNRETETPKGLGNALGSFFANTFIIKSNNPRNLFLRKGDIFFERDKKRAIFNYWTKTFLSGVVSSIGAANNKKKIKKMQEENLKKIQEEKKRLTGL